MTHRKHGLGLMTICLVAALGLMAFAASAQAKGIWNENGSAIPAGSFPKSVVSEEDTNHFVLLTKSGLSTIEILCEKLVVTEGKIEPEGTGMGTLTFEKNCVFKANGTALSACKPAEPITAKVKILLFKHLADGKTYALFSPLDGTLTFTTLSLGAQAPLKNECSFGEKIIVSGHAVVEDCNGLFSTEEVKHLVQQAPENKTLWTGSFKNELLYGANPAKLDGSVWLKLASGLKWSGKGVTED